jgi:hypothetical protein
VHGEGGAKSLRGMGASSRSYVFAQNGSVVGMSAVFNECVGAFHRTLAAQIGDALLGYDHLDGVLAAVQTAARGTMVLIFPPLAVEGQVKKERKALRAKSPEPPMPFIMFRPIT